MRNTINHLIKRLLLLWIIIWNAFENSKKRTGFFYRKKIFFSSVFRERIAAENSKLKSGMLTMTKKLFMEFFLYSKEKKWLQIIYHSGFEVSSTSTSILTRFNIDLISEYITGKISQRKILVVVEGR